MEMPGISSLVGAGLGLVGGVASGIVANKAHKDYAKTLKGLSMTIPEGVLDAEAILNNLSTQGLVGYDSMREKELSSLSTSISAYKDIVDNPSALLQATQTAEQNVRGKLNELAINDAIAKATNMKQLADFQSQIKGGYQSKIEDFENQKSMAIAQEKMLGIKELMSGITSGLSLGATTFSGMENLASQNSLSEALAKFYGGGQQADANSGTFGIGSVMGLGRKLVGPING